MKAKINALFFEKKLALTRWFFTKPAWRFRNERGFTILELIVVLAIMGVFLGLILANYAGSRGRRDLKIAQVELVTNIRKVQSYTLASRDTEAGPVKYYYLRFKQSNPTQYHIFAIQNDTETITLVETVNLPQNITINSIDYTQPIDASTEQTTCVEVAFALPFNKIYADPECAIDLLAQGTADPDDFAYALVNIEFLESQTNTTKSVSINGVTGVIDFQ